MTKAKRIMAALSILAVLAMIAPQTAGGAAAPSTSLPDQAADRAHDHSSHDHGPPSDAGPPPGVPDNVPTPPGLERHDIGDGRSVFTHGPDEHLATPEAGGDSAGYPLIITGKSVHSECVYDGTKPKAELVIAYPNDVPAPSRAAAGLDIRQQWHSMADSYGEQIREQYDTTPYGNAPFQFRIMCDSNGNPLIWYTQLPISKSADFGTIVNALRTTLHATNPDSKYMVFWQDTEGCQGGQGTIYNDSRKVGTNAHNGQHGAGATYGVIYDCVGNDDAVERQGAAILAHEYMHNMGATQQDSPNWDPYNPWHPRDEKDLMAYEVGTGGNTYHRCGLRQGVENIDCGKDDYFSLWGADAGYGERWSVGGCMNRFISIRAQGFWCQPDYNWYPAFYEK